MSRKIALILIVIIITVMSAYVYVRNNAAVERSQAASDENINGYNLEEDLRITQEIEKKEENRACCLSQQQKMQMLANLVPVKMNTVIKEYNSQLPETINNTIAYPYYNIAYDYLLITTEENVKLREKPSPDAAVLATIENLEKVTLLQRVEGVAQKDSNIWYRIAFENSNQIKEGYVNSTEGIPRTFHFNKMQIAINDLIKQLDQGELHFISNYKNYNGAPPQKGFRVDEFGYRVYHSAPAYQQADLNSDFRYIPDGLLVRLLNEVDDFYYINVPTFGGNYYVPKQYIDPTNTLKQLHHVVVVDRTQQNQAAFELNDKGLNLVSYTLATTGIAGDYTFVTTLGSYKAIEKKDRFQYLQKGTQEIAGYAPYAIRFTGGAYIHGVPVAYKEQNGNKVDPGTIEYLHTIGTFARSSMCVRNFTSHAKFLYDWMDIKNGAVIVIE